MENWLLQSIRVATTPYTPRSTLSAQQWKRFCGDGAHFTWVKQWLLCRSRTEVRRRTSYDYLVKHFENHELRNWRGNMIIAHQHTYPSPGTCLSEQLENSSHAPCRHNMFIVVFFVHERNAFVNFTTLNTFPLKSKTGL